MAFRTTAQLGPQLDDKFSGLPFWDSHLGVGRGTSFVADPSYKLGNVEFGDDGAEYHWVKASATIAATANTGTQVTITYPAYTVATGAGGFYTQPGVAYAAGDFMHVRRGAHNAVPA
jgi:hypothetical protein